MGVVSRKVFPVCGRMFVCCPALRSSSRQPGRRYKKLLSDIFSRSLEFCPDERKIMKLCEYASRNPLRTPKIAKCLEERCYKELRLGHMGLVNVVAETFNQLLRKCNGQMPYFAINLLSVITELLDSSSHADVQILGCQTLTNFIFVQADSTYSHNIENLVCKVSTLANKPGGDHQRRLCAAGLQCISAMVWFMKEFSTNFLGFDKMVHAILENYEFGRLRENGDASNFLHHNWVDEVVQGGFSVQSMYANSKPRVEKKDPSLLTREEADNPKVWAQICTQRLAELAKETTTVRPIADPMFIFFDTGKHWSYRGLAITVLSDMLFFLETPENEHSLMLAVIHHLDHKNVARDAEIKVSILQVASVLAREIESASLRPVEIGYIGDLCRHLKKSFQQSMPPLSLTERELNLNSLLQCSIEECLFAITRHISDVGPLFDLMAVALERVPPAGAAATAAIESVRVLAQAFSSSEAASDERCIPDALLVQILKAMLHPAITARTAAHQLFCGLFRSQTGTNSGGFERRCSRDGRCRLGFVPTVADAIRVRREGRPDLCSDVCWQTPAIVRFDEDQIPHLLSAFWLQIILPDNTPSNFEAIGLSFSLIVSSIRLKSEDVIPIVRSCQLLFSLLRARADNGISSSRRRSIVVLSISLLTLIARVYPSSHHSAEDVLGRDLDPYLRVGDDLRVRVNDEADAESYDSYADNQTAAESLSGMHAAISDYCSSVADALARAFTAVYKVDRDELDARLVQEFVPDIVGSHAAVPEHHHAKAASISDHSLSLDQDTSDEVQGDACIGIRQAMQSALDEAGRVVGPDTFAPPVSYGRAASRCKGGSLTVKLPTWLACDDGETPSLDCSVQMKEGCTDRLAVTLPPEPWLSMHLPPASPFDNFLRAARC